MRRGWPSKDRRQWGQQLKGSRAPGLQGSIAQSSNGSIGSRALVQHTTPPSLTHSPPTYIQYKPLRLPITHRGWPRVCGWGSLRGARLDPLRGRRMLCFCWIRLLLPNCSTAKVSGAPGDDRVGRVGKVVLGRASWQGLSSWLYSAVTRWKLGGEESGMSGSESGDGDKLAAIAAPKGGKMCRG